MALVKAARLDSLWSGEMIGLTLAGQKVLLINIEGTVLAYEDRCAHQAVPLSTGRLDGRVLTCSAHEWEYDACTGEGLNPSTVQLRRFPVIIEGGDILVDISPGAGAGRGGR